MTVNHKGLHQVERDLDAFQQQVRDLSALLTDRSPGARDIRDQQRAQIAKIKAQVDSIRAGGDWYEINTLLIGARNLDGAVRDMIDTLKHPMAGFEAYRRYDETMP